MPQHHAPLMGASMGDVGLIGGNQNGGQHGLPSLGLDVEGSGMDVEVDVLDSLGQAEADYFAGADAFGGVDGSGLHDAHHHFALHHPPTFHGHHPAHPHTHSQSNNQHMFQAAQPPPLMHHHHSHVRW